MIENRLISELNERSLIYCIMNNEEDLLKVIETFSIDSFGSSVCSEIYNAILSAFEEGQEVLKETIIAKLSNTLIEHFNYIMDSKVDIDKFEVYYNIVKDKEVIRKCHNLCKETTKNIKNIGKSGSQIIDELQIKLNELTQTTYSEIGSLGTNIFDIIPNPDTYKEGDKREFIGISSGYKKLDEITLGFHKGCFTVIAGRPSEGKSELTRNILLHNALQGIPVLLFSMDEAESIVKMKLTSTITEIDYNHLKKYELTKQELNKLKNKIELIKELPFFIDNTTSLTVSIIRSKIKKMLYKYPELGAVGIDYVQLMGVTNDDLTRVVNHLKNLCIEINIPFFVISQLSRNVENRKQEGEKWSEAPLLSDLRQTGTLEQALDKAIFIKAEPPKTEEGMFKKERRTRIWIPKQRDGEAGVYFDMINKGRIQKLIEKNWHEQEEELEILPF